MPEKKAKLADNKIKPTTKSAAAYIKTIEHEQKRKDSLVLLEMMTKATKTEPTLWSNGMIGFGMKRHTSPTSGREADWMRIAFAPRKANMMLYFGAYVDTQTAALEKLGKHKAGMGCVYINKLADIDLKVLREMIEAGWKLK
jgi:hypothetical protein